MAVRPFAVFDIDGTIIRWQLYHAIADEMARQGSFAPDKYKKVRAARMAWKRRAHQDSFDEYEQTLVDTFNQALANIEVEQLRDACWKVIDEYKDQVYTYTRNLIEDLKAKGYLLFAVSASQDQIVKMLASHYGFDDARGSVYETIDGHFTGQVDVLRSERKPIALQELIDAHGATKHGSIGVGDSESDIPMLDRVERPIAFNPTKGLFDYAEAKGWQVVVERKNVIYQLGPEHGSYLLTKTRS